MPFPDAQTLSQKHFVEAPAAPANLPTKRSWWPWIVGGAAVVIVGHLIFGEHEAEK